MAHPLMLRAIAAAKKKNDTIDASKLADCLRCDFLPECHMMPREIRDRCRTLRYRHLLVRQIVQMKNRVSGLLMETGVEHNKQRLHKVGYFREMLSGNAEIDGSILPLLKLSRETIERCQKGPADCRLSEGVYAPEALFELFWDWQRTQTQSSVTAPSSPRQQMDVRFCEEQEPPAARHTCARRNLHHARALSQARPEHLRLLLTTDLHGCRLNGNYHKVSPLARVGG
jgi:hypothetical protein